MRVPLLIVIPLSLLIIFVTWWLGAKDKDFMTPPSEASLEEIRQEALASLPEPNNNIKDSPIAASNPAREENPTFDLGDLSQPPKLDEYVRFAEHGSEYLISLALKLEAEGQFQRALTAWERVIDHTRPNDSQRETAISSIERLRPTLPDWNSDPSKADTIILHAGTGKRSAGMLKQPLENICRTLTNHSSGLVKVLPKVTAGQSDLSLSGSSPVAIWFSGQEKHSPSTEVLSFTFGKTDELPSQLEASVFFLIRGHLARNTTLTPIPNLTADKIDENTLTSSVTRFSWKNFAALLTPPPETPKKPATKNPSPQRSR